jgi:Tol biopolymer transport system component
MSLSAGSRLGPFEIQSPLGQGGMGEVYKARDTRLDRTVAIKVLPSHLAADSQFRNRFDREARAISALDHPHICALYDVGRDGQVDFLVMQYLEGETLAHRLQKGALPLDQALRNAIEIADALDKAHRQGIVHRDLKPGNVMLTKSGVKLLDFGLAKLQATGAVVGMSVAATMTSPLTAQGTILGTLQYMAPEQLEGRESDARSDIFAFGAVLYEMLTGKKAFEGKSQASVISAIMSAEPEPLLKLQPITPPTLDRIVATCLAKDPDDRWQTAADLKRELKWTSENASPLSMASHREALSQRMMSVVVAMALAAIVVIGIFVWSMARPGPAPLQPTHVPVATPPGVVLFHALGNPTVAISSDGRRLVYAGSSQGQRLYLQDLDRPGAAAPIAGTEGGLNPFFSSDGKWLAFVANNKLQKVPLIGAEPVRLADASHFKGGAWSPDDETIYFVPHLDTGVWKVSAGGGTPVQITTPDRDGYDSGHWWPAILPGGRRLLYTSCCGRDRIMALDLVTGQRTLLIENGFFATYASTGHLVFAQGPALLAAGFDPDSLKVTLPMKILDSIVTGYEKHAQYAISKTGTFVYFDGVSDFQRTLVRIDRNGAIRQIAKGPRGYTSIMRLAPDGRHLALTTYEAQTDLFVYDLLRDDLDRVTLDPHNDFNAVWTPDGRNLVFTSIRRGQLDLYMGPADKSRPEELLYASDFPKFASSWSPDGQLLAFVEEHPGRGNDIWIYSSRDKKARPFREASFFEDFPQFSPDGRWLVYQSDELGHFEIYAAPYPGPGPTCKVSTSGGAEPRWSADGTQIFYRRGSTAMVVDVADRQFCTANPQGLFEGLEPGMWDVSPKGDFFVTLAPREPPRLHLVLNWFEELKRLVPTR